MGVIIRVYPVFCSIFNQAERNHIISIAMLGINEYKHEHNGDIEKTAESLARSFIQQHTMELDTSNRIKEAKLTKRRGLQLIDEMTDTFINNYHQLSQEK